MPGSKILTFVPKESSRTVVTGSATLGDSEATEDIEGCAVEGRVARRAIEVCVSALGERLVGGSDTEEAGKSIRQLPLTPLRRAIAFISSTDRPLSGNTTRKSPGESSADGITWGLRAEFCFSESAKARALLGSLKLPTTSALSAKTL
jgi:hypothetical protein